MTNTGTAIAVFLAILLGAYNADAYSKYGRSCKDIGCRSSEVCVMAEDPCTIHRPDSCGSYPTCKKISQPVSSSSGGSTSGQQLGTEINNNNYPPQVPADPSGSRYANSNPYGNANAPPADEVNHPYGNHPNNNPVYPPYPSNNNHNNNGYPPYPSGNNRPGAPVDQYGYPVYPPTQYRPEQSNNRYPNAYPQHNMPQHSPGWGNGYPNTIHRRNGAALSTVSILALLVPLALAVLGCRLIAA
ncbi:protein transport protein SEC9 isoform X2 [Copidosoma floridanum]|uniref:protein transport protein SEC9 isoform X2 n=1 Tax=Copidosoma floridanum TaxID=29053 RepID=UPI0006C98EE0|nr:protein transport protein SEC9 isoform X2 [Copidosoma floridanum]